MEPTSPNQRLSKIWPKGSDAVVDGIKGKIVYSDDFGNVRLERGNWKIKTQTKLLGRLDETPHV